ncbi:MAG TPA: hypothetical protein VJ487_17135 [Alphaproteobacteria bacterium]|nr:hypothetical protein [Alphaproteobacteria bacterium]
MQYSELQYGAQRGLRAGELPQEGGGAALFKFDGARLRAAAGAAAAFVIFSGLILAGILVRLWAYLA